MSTMITTTNYRIADVIVVFATNERFAPFVEKQLTEQLAGDEVEAQLVESAIKSLARETQVELVIRVDDRQAWSVASKLANNASLGRLVDWYGVIGGASTGPK